MPTSWWRFLSVTCAEQLLSEPMGEQRIECAQFRCVSNVLYLEPFAAIAQLKMLFAGAGNAQTSLNSLPKNAGPAIPSSQWTFLE